MREFHEVLAESRRRWKPSTKAEQICQIVGAANGYTTARVCRANFSEAAEEIMNLCPAQK